MSVQRYNKQTDTLTPIAGRTANESVDLEQIRKSPSLNGKVASASAVKTIDAELNGVEGMMSDAWNNTKTYAVGEYCIYNNSLWRCKVQHSGQTPADGTYWESKTILNKTTITYITGKGGVLFVLQKCGNLVTLCGTVNALTTALASGDTVVTLPVGYRPKVSQFGLAINWSNNFVQSIYDIDTNGRLLVWTTFPQNQGFRISPISFFTD